MKWIVKIVLVALVIWAFLIANQIVQQNQAMFKKHVNDSMVRMNAPPPSANWVDTRPAPQFPWRRYPGAKLVGHRAWKMNEVPFTEGEYNVTAAPRDVIDYYRNEMARSGWRDETENYFNIEPEVLAESGQMEILQSSNFMEKYEKITEANLVLRRGQQSIYVTIRPPDKKNWKTTFNLTRADTPSAKDLWIDTYTNARKTSHQHPFTKQFTMEEDIRDKHMASTTYTSLLPPHALHKRVAKELLESKGWKDETIPVGLRFPNGSRVQAFTRGKSFALLSVRYDENMRMSTALLTQEDPQ